jgi:hypothetical protein
MGDENDTSRASVLYSMGRALLEGGAASEAVDFLRRSWSISPHAHTAYFLVKALHAIGDVHESRRWNAEAYQLNPRNSMIATAHASALSDAGAVSDAIKILYGVLDQTRTYGPAKKLLGELEV